MSTQSSNWDFSISLSLPSIEKYASNLLKQPIPNIQAILSNDTVCKVSHGVTFMEYILIAFTPEKKFLYWLVPGSRNGDVHSHFRGLEPISNFFPPRITQLATKLLHCFVLFLEVAEPVFRQSGIERNPFSLLHKSAWRCSFLRTIKGQMNPPDLSILLILSTCKFYNSHNWHNSTLENMSKEVGAPLDPFPMPK